jgi:hypothetical protein
VRSHERTHFAAAGKEIRTALVAALWKRILTGVVHGRLGKFEGRIAAIGGEVRFFDETLDIIMPSMAASLRGHRIL